MIASVRGIVGKVGLDHLIVEVGGVGLRIHATPATAASYSTGADAFMHTSLVVREESLTLYGFGDENARLLFEQVQTVSGVGPRLAQAMLSVHEPDVVRRAIAGGDLVSLTKVPGIGRKGAERIVLELKDKMAVVPADGRGSAVASTSADAVGTADPDSGQVVEALVGLGWSSKQAEGAVRTARQAARGSDHPGGSDHIGGSGGQSATPAGVAALLRAALRELGR
ncbi:MAG: Holliday junction branch migration protein RuvA [Ornithinimicrobium sp.]